MLGMRQELLVLEFAAGACNGLDEYSYSFAVNASLTAGTYWLVLHNGPTGSIPDAPIYWAWSNGDTGNSASQDLAPLNLNQQDLNPPSGQPWVGNSAELAFQLDATDAPEPVSFSLVGGSILAACLFGRKAKTQKGLSS